MNEELSTYARTYLKENISKCTEGQIHVFKMMYSSVNPDQPIDKVIDNMPEEKLDWAMSQIKNTLKNETNDGRVPDTKKES